MTDERSATGRTTALRRRTLAAAAAAPLALLAVGAVPAAAAEDPAKPATDRPQTINVPIEAAGEISIDGRTYETGPLEGQVNLHQERQNGAFASDGVLYNPVGEVGDLGQIRVTTVDREKARADKDDPAAYQEIVLSFEIEQLAGVTSEGPVVFETAPFALAPEEALDVKAFPPVNQQLSIPEGVHLVEPGTDSAAGLLEAFTVTVNPSE
ncbi:hypothetical protein SAMN05216270_101597 [Glycomyces harbinensis]|uniref:Uncharacterized protein n=2 Tax=Glycomyces harbinensis TaxID=58114 RepID=A0A1G6RRL4_9ACTN|nr:hypothetical protein SAMN05216270_101597 [Glycomyces harbinensis]